MPTDMQRDDQIPSLHPLLQPWGSEAEGTLGTREHVAFPSRSQCRGQRAVTDPVHTRPFTGSRACRLGSRWCEHNWLHLEIHELSHARWTVPKCLAFCARSWGEPQHQVLSRFPALPQACPQPLLTPCQGPPGSDSFCWRLSSLSCTLDLGRY